MGEGQIIGIESQRFQRDNARHEGSAFSDSLLPIESVHSTVYLTETASLASKEMSAIESGRAHACFRRDFFGASTETKEPLMTNVAIDQLPAPLPGVRSYSLRATTRLAINVPGATGRSNYYEDTLGFVIGRALIMLHTTGDPQPLPSTVERRLLSLLYHRAVEHKL